MNATEHTPTPWKVIGKKTIRAVNDATDYHLIGKTHWFNGEADAAFIVEACNSFATLSAHNRELIAQNSALVVALTSATVTLDAIENHIVSMARPNGPADFADEGRMIRGALQALLPELVATLKAANALATVRK